VKECAIKQLVEEYYNIGSISGISCLTGGYGSSVYQIEAETGVFILRNIENNGMNHPENEAAVVSAVHNAGIPTAEIIATRDGCYLAVEGDGTYQLRRYVPGVVFNPNAAPPWLIREAAVILGKIQRCLDRLPPLPVGIGQAYFDWLTPERAEEMHLRTLDEALRRHHTDIVEALTEKIKMIGQLDPSRIEMRRLTCKNTHGDYKIQQLICGKNRINAVIDFTCAATHPLCFEIIRSYTLAAPECASGRIDIDCFKKYIADYLKYGTLSADDLRMMPYLFYYQQTAADYFGQYYAMVATDNGGSNEGARLLLRDAFFSVRLCRWLEQHMTRLEDALKAGI
jgi:Ser/Thr protein kinase RdoA (MazF antagonist)